MPTKNKFSNLPILETERLLLQELTLENAEDLFEYASDPDVSKYNIWSVHKSLEDSKRFLSTVMEQYKNHELADWGIITQSRQETHRYLRFSGLDSRSTSGRNWLYSI